MTAPRWAPVVSLPLAVLGLGLSAYLAYEHATGTRSLACPETGRVDCLKVTTSSYSVLAGIPVAYLGVAFYVLVVAVMTPIAWRSLSPLVQVGVMATGLAFVLYLVWAEFFGLDAICLWCTAVHLVTFGLFAITLIVLALRE